MEVECPSVTPEVVLKASGHVDRFNDLMVKDVKTLECFRADHLLKGACSCADACIRCLTLLPTAHLEAMKMDPLLDAPKRASIEDALARLDEYKASDMDVAFAKFGVKVRGACSAACSRPARGLSQCACAPNAVTGDEERPVARFRVQPHVCHLHRPDRHAEGLSSP